MKHLMLIFFIFISASLRAQNPDSTLTITEKIYSFTEVIPEWKDGKEALFGYLSSNLHYPKEALQKCISGTVYVQFIVEKDGSINENVKLLRGIGYGCDEEAMRVVKNMPKWKPGKQSGEPVRVYWNLPIKFEIPADCTPAPANDNDQ